jgi:CRP-like cAMP-binding protein
MVLLDEGKVVGLDLISNPERVPRSQRAVEAYGKTAVIVMRGEELRKLMIVVPKLALNAINILAHVINSIDSRRRLMIFDVKQRVAAFLYLVSKSQKHLYYTDKAMADELFTTRESVNRAISVLQNAGHITKSQRKIVVNNRDALIRDLNPKKQTKKPRAR